MIYHEKTPLPFLTVTLKHAHTPLYWTLNMGVFIKGKQ